MNRRAVMIAVAASLASADLAYKATTHADYHHVRSPLAVLAATFVVIALVLVVPRLPSRAALTGAAVATGGAIGNLISVLVWTEGVPDPLVVGNAEHGIAFNLADVFVFMGDAVMLSAVVVYALRNRAHLRTSV